jgi:hypothetical protein
MASQLTSMYGGGGGFDQALAGMLQGEDIDQARGQDAMAQQQRMQIAQQEMAQRQRELALGALLSQQGQEQDIRMEQMRQQGRMKELEFAAGQEKIIQQRIEAEAEKARKFQLHLAEIEAQTTLAIAKGDEAAASRYNADAVALQDEISKSSARIFMLTAGQGKTQAEFDSLIASVTQKMEEMTSVEEGNDTLINQFSPNAMANIVDVEKGVSVETARGLQSAQGADILRSISEFGGLASPFGQAASLIRGAVGPAVPAGVGQITGLQYLKLSPTVGFEGLSPTAEASAGFVAGVDSPEEIREKLVRTTAQGLARTISTIPGVQNFDQQRAERVISNIISGDFDPKAMQELSSLGINPSVLKGIMRQVAVESGKEANKIESDLQASYAGGAQDNLQLKAMSAASIAAGIRRDILAKAASGITVTDLGTLKSLSSQIRGFAERGDLSGLYGLEQKAGTVGLEGAFGRFRRETGGDEMGPPVPYEDLLADEVRRREGLVARQMGMESGFPQMEAESRRRAAEEQLRGIERMKGLFE